MRLRKKTVEPLPEHVSTIRNYPIPQNITDMRSFFALVEQVSPFYTVKPHIKPFQELLKKNNRLYWDKNHQNLFDKAKETIAKCMIEGLIRFKTNRETALLSDWSKTGMGFFMAQKYCSCNN